MPTPTYTPLANVTLASGSGSVTFSSIPATYRDLILIIDGTSTVVTSLYIRANGDTGANYTFVRMVGNGTSTSSNSGTENGFIQAAMDTVKSSNIVQIMDYSATDKHKTSLVRQNLINYQAVAAAEIWANTAAITSLVVAGISGSFNAGSTFSLYGVIA
jgi:hypothetical protein